MTPATLLAVAFGLAIIAGYVWLGVFCAKQAWTLSGSVRQRWVRVLIVSAIIVLFFLPGLVAGGHGVGIGPAWMMFATGAFHSLTAASKLKVVGAIVLALLVVFAVGLALSRPKSLSTPREEP